MASRTHQRVALLSIKPRFSQSILRGEKLVEFRKTGLPEDIQYVLIYETAPTKRLVGWFSIDRVERAAPSTLWRRHSAHSGATRSEFLSYFAEKPHGFAIVIKSVRPLAKQLGIESAGLMQPPQSFCYIGGDTFTRLTSRSTRRSHLRPAPDIVEANRTLDPDFLC
jgi:predicted transcriptional regulator